MLHARGGEGNVFFERHAHGRSSGEDRAPDRYESTVSSFTSIDILCSGPCDGLRVDHAT